MKVVIKTSAVKELEDLPQEVYPKVRAAILSLVDAPYPRRSKKVKGTEIFRLRVGRFRILYRVEKASETVVVIAVRHRKEAYR